MNRFTEQQKDPGCTGNQAQAADEGQFTHSESLSGSGETELSPEERASRLALPLGRESRYLFYFSLGSFALYAILAVALDLVFGQSAPLQMLSHGGAWPVQLAIGMAAGAAAGLLAWLVFKKSVLKGILDDFLVVRTIRHLPLTRFDRIQLSLFAGAGEELLFRGAVQPLLGLWVTSLLFIALHGYISLRSVKHLIFGLFMTALAVMLGLLFEHVGLLAAITAHAVYDLLALELLIHSDKLKKQPESVVNIPRPPE